MTDFNQERSTTIRVFSSARGVPKSLRIDYDLSQQHVSVKRETVVNQFITDIQNLGRASIERDYPRAEVEVINGVNGPGLRWKDITLALDEIWITSAHEKKSHHGGARKQRDQAAGYAAFTVREHWSGMPIVLGQHPGVKTYAQISAKFHLLFSAMVDDHVPNAAMPIPCEMIPGQACPIDRDPTTVPFPGYPLGYKVEF